MIRIFRAALELASLAAFIAVILLGCDIKQNPPTCKAGSALTWLTNCEVKQ